MNLHPPPPAGTLLHADGIVVRRDGRAIVDDLSLRIDPGLVLAIIGPNGAGKSTLLKAVLGLEPRDAGTVRVRDAAGALHDIDRLDRARRAACMAYVPQRSLLQARLRVDQVVAMGRFAHRGARLGLGAADHRAIARALAEADVADLAERDFATLSGGEQARVLIARALATEARALLLDEPTASLDVGHALDLLRLLRDLAASGMGIAIVLHDLNQARNWTDLAILMHHGRGVDCGPASEIVSDARIRPVYGVSLVDGGGFGYRRARSGEAG